MKDEGWRMKDEGWRMKDEGWRISSCWGFCFWTKLTDKQKFVIVESKERFLYLPCHSSWRESSSWRKLCWFDQTMCRTDSHHQNLDTPFDKILHCQCFPGTLTKMWSMVSQVVVTRVTDQVTSLGFNVNHNICKLVTSS